MSPLEETILAEQLSDSIDNPVSVSISIGYLRYNRIMSRLAFKVLAKEYAASSRHHVPHLSCKRGPKRRER